MADTALVATNRQVMKVYAARAYTSSNPRTSQYIEVNIPDYEPTVPQDNSTENISLSSNFFANQNFPVTTGTVKMAHSIQLPLLGGSSCPICFAKGTPFLLFTPTRKIEEGYLLFI